MKNGPAFALGLLSGVVGAFAIEKLIDNKDNKTINGGSAKKKIMNGGEFTDPNVVFSDDKTTLIEYPSTNTSSEYIIPDGVTTIDSNAFYRCTSLETISIPSSVTTIGDGAFYGCISLTSITVDKNNKNYYSIDGVLFNKDKTLLLVYPCAKNDTSYEIPSLVTSIGYGAFSYCTSLKTITIPSSLQITSIGSYAFLKCTALTKIAIPSLVTTIGDYAFYGCISLETIAIPSLVTTIGDYAFYGCISLTSITVDKNNKNYYSIDGVLFNKDKTLLLVYPCAKNDTSYEIPSLVTSIGSNAFSGCTLLEKIAIPSLVTTIGYSAFYACKSLTTITIPSAVTTIGYSAFSQCSSLETVTITSDSQLTTIGSSAFSGCSSLVPFDIPASVTSIGDDIFKGCKSPSKGGKGGKRGKKKCET